MKRTSTLRWRSLAAVLLAVVAGLVGTVTFRALRVGKVTYDWLAQIRYQIESGESIAETPAAEALAVGYLETIFGDNQELLGKLKGVVQRGLEDSPSLNLGTVSAMLVTYHRDENDQVKDVVAHVLGGFPLGKRKPGFHRDGYFRHLVDRDIWTMGNAVISLLGRDMILFAEEGTAKRQQEILEALFTYGDVLPLAESLYDPMYFTAVFPDPKRLLPLQLRHHVQAVVFKGQLQPEKGILELVLLTPSSRSASYALSILSDMQVVGETALETTWHGALAVTPWNAQWVDTWWAYEMIQASERTVFEKQHNILRAKSDLERVMVNVLIKSVERMGRDLAQQRASLEERLDPRLVDERLYSSKPQHYWSDSHRWGPDWPFRGALTGAVEQAAADVVPVPAAPAPATPAAPPTEPL